MEIPGRLRIAALDWGCLTQPEVPLQCVFGGQVVPAWLNETTGLLECDIPPFPTAFETLPFWIRLPQPEIPSSWDIPNPAEGETIVLPEQDRYALPIAARHFFSYTNSSEEGLEPTVQAMCESCHPFAESFCALDCAGVFQGEAFLDSCGVCSGGTSGHVPDSDLDCNGQCFGNWTLDASGNCRLVENATECCANVREPRPCQEFDPMSVSAGSGASLFAEGHDPVRPRILYSFTSGLHSDARTAVTDFFDDFLESATWTRSDVSDVDDAPLQRVRLNFTISLWEGHHVREVFLSPDGELRTAASSPSRSFCHFFSLPILVHDRFQVPFSCSFPRITRRVWKTVPGPFSLGTIRPAVTAWSRHLSRTTTRVLWKKPRCPGLPPNPPFVCGITRSR